MRLTNEIKDKLTQNLLEASPLFTKARNVVAARQKLVEDIRQSLLKQYDLTDEKIDEMKASIKENGFVRVDTIKKSALRVSVKGEARDLQLNGLDERHRRDGKYIGLHTLESAGVLGAKITEPVTKQYIGVDNQYVPLQKTDRIYDELIKSDLAIDSLYQEVYAFRRQVKAALSQVTTLNKLKEVWPDAVPYLPEPVKHQSTAVALPVETLNAICGLPK